MFKNLSKSIVITKNISVSDERKALLQPLVDYIQNKVNLQEQIRLNFICTHNSRRSHLSQIWAQTMAFHLCCKI
jgi:arsenate reductase